MLNVKSNALTSELHSRNQKGLVDLLVFCVHEEQGGGAVGNVVIDTFETRESGRKGEFGTLGARRFGL